MSTKIKCPHCGNTMSSILQTSLTGKRPDYFLYTCWSKDCRGYGFTLSEDTLNKQKGNK